VSLPSDPDAFWGKQAPSEESFGEVRIPAVPAALVKRLGSFPFWRGEENFVPALELVYREAAAVGMDVFLGVTRAALALGPRRQMRRRQEQGGPARRSEGLWEVET
jgi:hypothetical protein